MAVEKRIPNGTKVRWQSRHESDPVHEGKVLEFIPKTRPGGSDIYEVHVPGNKPSRRIMYPRACSLERDNPGKLRRVK